MPRAEYGNTEGEAVLCPLFKGFTNNEIRCESHVPEASCVIIRYRNDKNCDKQRKLYCEENWKRCEHYLSWLHMKWED